MHLITNLLYSVKLLKVIKKRKFKNYMKKSNLAKLIKDRVNVIKLANSDILYIRCKNYKLRKQI